MVCSCKNIFETFDINPNKSYRLKIVKKSIFHGQITQSDGPKQAQISDTVS